VGEPVVVEADIYSHGHDELAVDLLYKREEESTWQVAPMELADFEGDHWRGEFPAEERGTYVFTLQAWVDHFATWKRNFALKAKAGQASKLDLDIGAGLLETASRNSKGEAARRLSLAAQEMKAVQKVDTFKVARDVAKIARRHRDAQAVAKYEQNLRVLVERKRAAFSTWYEMFPRSASPDPDRPGTFADVEARLPYVRGMGFDVLYLPPIHPIGAAFRKGVNNSLTAVPGDPGSPWAIGSKAGGHKAINRDLGTLADFRHLVKAAREMDLEVALDIAFQCSPDHPYVREHPEWFKMRPDGSIQYAENPPKKYQDVYPFDWDTPDWQAMWEELKSVFLYWVDQGVKIFRVDNPHTKPFAFWEWCIHEVRSVDPDVIFLAEAFTRLRVMYRLSQVGFTQSYSYFPWKINKAELTEYFSEVSTPPVVDFFRASNWPNTPDILTRQMRAGLRSTFILRLVLAATLSPNYGIYGPTYELTEHLALEEGSDEYLNSEKYEIRHWDVDRTDSLRGLITALNRARHDNPALQSSTGLRFHEIANPKLIAYSRTSPDGSNVVLGVVNLDPKSAQSGYLKIVPSELGLKRARQEFDVCDLLSGETSTWRGPAQKVRLDPAESPAMLLRVSLPSSSRGTA